MEFLVPKNYFIEAKGKHSRISFRVSLLEKYDFPNEILSGANTWKFTLYEDKYNDRRLRSAAIYLDMLLLSKQNVVKYIHFFHWSMFWYATDCL